MTTLVAMHGRLTASTTDTIVNAANRGMRGGSGG